MKSERIIVMTLLSVALIIASAVIGRSVINRNIRNQAIMVTGMAERNFESDLIVWQSQFTVKKFNLTEAYAELKKQSETTRQFLLSKGVSKDEITFSAVEINRDFSYTYGPNGNIASSNFDGFRLTQSVKINSKNVSKIETISREITELINQGIEITSLAPEYYYTKLSDLKIEMLAEAAKDAYNRAETMAINGKGKLGTMVDSNMGVFQIIAQNSSEDYSWGGSYNTSSKLKTATITVKSKYLLK